MTWTAPEVGRSVQLGDLTGLPERGTLEGWLDWQRETLLAKCAGLDGEQLVRAAVEPSSLTLLGLVRHMAEVERSWFRRRVAGEDVGAVWPEDGEEGFGGVDAGWAERDFGRYRDEVEAARAAVAGRGLDETFVAASGRRLSVRWVYVHMIQEYARHNGHADLLRERTDRRTGD
ncbi:DinB family protein [Streptomyces sp. NRRL F-5123]|uniref:DinB family protein n=1 Tax=Streptomyces sp. NRRL F-5123 TaxID=1463856 RepID=UPI0004E2871A|nr:DinB family protein [Streptomyces sp. NRRL F-5123]